MSNYINNLNGFARFPVFRAESSDSSSPGILTFTANNDASAPINFGNIYTDAIVNTAGNESGEFFIDIFTEGTLYTILQSEGQNTLAPTAMHSPIFIASTSNYATLGTYNFKGTNDSAVIVNYAYIGATEVSNVNEAETGKMNFYVVNNGSPSQNFMNSYSGNGVQSPNLVAAANDFSVCGNLNFTANNDTPLPVSYTSIGSTIISNVTGSEEASMNFYQYTSGSINNFMNGIYGGVQSPSFFASQSDFSSIGNFVLIANNDTPIPFPYAFISGTIVSNVSGSEDCKMNFYAYSSGVNLNFMNSFSGLSITGVQSPNLVAAANDFSAPGVVSFIAYNDTTAKFKYASIETSIISNVTGSESGEVLINSSLAGVNVQNITATGVGTSVLGLNDGSTQGTGYIGEILQSSVVIGSAVSLTTATPTDLGSLVLTAGLWNISALFGFNADSGAVVGTLLQAGVCLTTGVFNQLGFDCAQCPTMPTAACDNFIAIPPYNLILNTAYAIYFTVQADFSVGTVKAYGSLIATRVG